VPPASDGDGESACRRGSVHRALAGTPAGWSSICAAYLGTSAGPAVPRLALLRVGFAEPSGSPRALVRSYRTVSPSPVPDLSVRPSAVCFLWHCPAGRPDWPLASTLPCGAPTFLDQVDAWSRPPGRLTVEGHGTREGRRLRRERTGRRPRRGVARPHSDLHRRDCVASRCRSVRPSAAEGIRREIHPLTVAPVRDFVVYRRYRAPDR